MPFDSLAIESVLFLSLLTILASLPNEPYFYPWYDSPSSYRISHSLHGPLPQRRSNTQYENQFYYSPPHQNRGYELEQRGRNPQDYGGDPRQHHHHGGGQSRRSDAFPGTPGEDGCGRDNVDSSYSSHVNYAETNQKGEKAPENVRQNVEPMSGFDGSVNGDFQNASRNVRTDGNKKGEPKPRIVTPRTGRPEQGRPAKNPNSVSISISTTEKTFRNQTTKASKKPRPNRLKNQGGDIVFPDVYTRKFIPKVTKCAKKTTFCEHLGEEYPSEHISQVLKVEGAMFREFFGSDTIPVQVPVQGHPNIGLRIHTPDENSLCPYRQEVVFPRAAQNKEDKWLFIINQDQYVQGVTVEVCLNPESRCILTEGFPLGYTPYCKQKYIERRLVAIGEDGKPHSDSFRLPSCCSCVVKHEPTARTGLNSDSSFN